MCFKPAVYSVFFFYYIREKTTRVAIHNEGQNVGEKVLRVNPGCKSNAVHIIYSGKHVDSPEGNGTYQPWLATMWGCFPWSRHALIAKDSYFYAG